MTDSTSQTATVETRWHEGMIQNAQSLTRDELPPQHQKALEEWGFASTVTDCRYLIGDVPTDKLVEIVMSISNKHTDLEKRWSGDWEAYHAWYVSTERNPEKRWSYEGAGENYPLVISPLSKYFIEDGWHRFHRYVEVGLLAIPVLVLSEDEDLLL